MDYLIYNRQDIKEDVIDSKTGDVNGDNIPDEVFITGTRNKTIAVSDIAVNIKDGKTSVITKVKLKTNIGYDPEVFLGDLTGDSIDNILVSIESGNTGLEGYHYVFSFLDNKQQLLFDYVDFNNKYQYAVDYKNNYVVDVISKFDDTRFTIDIRNKQYLSQIYNSNGSLKKPLKGLVSAIVNITPVFNPQSRIYELYATQRVIGYYNADVLGQIITPLMWNGNQFVARSKPYFVA